MRFQQAESLPCVPPGPWGPERNEMLVDWSFTRHCDALLE
jgi:hypothetical protein